MTPFFWERTARQIQRYGMPRSTAFSTDFPHPEGGTDPIGRLAGDIEPLGDDAVEAFFVRNAELLLPAGQHQSTLEFRTSSMAVRQQRPAE